MINASHTLFVLSSQKHLAFVEVRMHRELIIRVIEKKKLMFQTVSTLTVCLHFLYNTVLQCVLSGDTRASRSKRPQRTKSELHTHTHTQLQNMHTIHFHPHRHFLLLTR